MKYFIVMISIILCVNILASDGSNMNSSNSNNGEHNSKSHLNHIAIFNGITTTVKESHNYYTLGIDYVRKFSETSSFGIGIFGEIIFAEHKEYAIGIPLFYKIVEGFWIRTGPGIEIVKEAKDTEIVENHGTSQLAKIASSVDPHAELEDKVKFLYRIGLMYSIHLGPNFGISPSIDLDLVDNHNALVYGINLGWAF